MSHYGLADVNQRLFLFAISREALAVMPIDQSKNFKKKVNETGIARCTGLLNDQTLDKVA